MKNLNFSLVLRVQIPFRATQRKRDRFLFQCHGFSQIIFFMFVLVLFPNNMLLIRSISVVKGEKDKHWPNCEYTSCYYY